MTQLVGEELAPPGEVQESRSDAGQLAGCDVYIAKPLRYKELYAAIDTPLARGKPQAASEADPLHHAP